MGQSPPTGTSDLVVPAPPLPGEPQGLVVYVTRVPFDEFFTLKMTINGRESTEELEAEDTRKWFKERFIKAASLEQEMQWDEALNKALDECWNFGATKITIPPGIYREPTKLFPQFQPKV